LITTYSGVGSLGPAAAASKHVAKALAPARAPRSATTAAG
jgi:hypothetical protein